MKPIFVPLKTEWFLAFYRREKSIEYRLYGPRWNEKTCPIGRSVTLSHGYSGKRLTAEIIDFAIVSAETVSESIGLYPRDALLAAISLKLSN